MINKIVKTKLNDKLYFILLDQEYLSKNEFNSLGLSEDELKLLTNKVPIDGSKKISLIEIVGDSFKINFVGEYKTIILYLFLKNSQKIIITVN